MGINYLFKSEAMQCSIQRNKAENMYSSRVCEIEIEKRAKQCSIIVNSSPRIIKTSYKAENIKIGRAHV